MKIKCVKLSEMLDDNSQYMNQLEQKFEEQYGEELERIMGRKVSAEHDKRLRISGRETKTSS
ncbi:hypothetical protein N9E09_00775 [bacterium]|jgi:hypothetical protein|nr:hypothetical protein [bacterium]